MIQTALDGRVFRQRSRPSHAVPDSFSCIDPAAAGGCAAAGGGVCDVTCTPVVEAPNGRIRHLLITFENPPRGEPAAPGACRPHTGAADRAAAADPGCAVIFSRIARRATRLGGAPDTAPLAVVVTPELVAGLADLSLRQAAAAAGVSPSAFKKACRKIGLSRWAYKRRRPAGRRGQAPPPGPRRPERASGCGFGAVWACSEPEYREAGGWALLDGPAADAGFDCDPGPTLAAAAALAAGWALPEPAAADEALVREMLDTPWPMHG